MLTGGEVNCTGQQQLFSGQCEVCLLSRISPALNICQFAVQLPVDIGLYLPRNFNDNTHTSPKLPDDKSFATFSCLRRK